MTQRLIKEDKFKSIENKSLVYFLPMLGEFRYDFVNLRAVFIWCEDHPELDNHIFLLFKKSTLQDFNENQTWLKSFSNYCFSYEPDNFHIMLVFLPPDLYSNDYRQLKNSKYSQISDRYKRHIFKFFNITKAHEFKSLHGVLYKQEYYRKALEEKLDVIIPEDIELASLLDPSEETYTNDMKVLTNVDNSDLIG